MALINPDLSGIVDGAVGDAADWTTPFNTITNAINGNLDNSNLSSTAAIDPTKIATRVLGYAQATADQTGITTITDLTNLSVAVTVPSGGGRVRISAQVLAFSDLDAQTVELSIREGSTTLQLGDWQTHITSGTPNQTVCSTWVGTPSSGSHTYKLSISTTGGTTGIHATATDPSFILVELL